jgi:hypothetical protein
MEAVRDERRAIGEELLFRASEGRRGTAPMERANRERQTVARSVSGQARGVGTTRIPGGTGAALPSQVRQRMEPKLGANLGNVRIHTGDESAQAAKGFAARAFTVGEDVHFNAGEFNPGTREGDKLIAHELTHVVQGQKSGVSRKEEEKKPDDKAAGDKAPENDDQKQGAASTDGEAEVSKPEDPAEKEADAKADEVTDELHEKGEEEADGGDKKADEKPGEKADKKADEKPGEKADKKADEKPGEKTPEIAAKLEGVGLKIHRAVGAPAGAPGAAPEPSAAKAAGIVASVVGFFRRVAGVDEARRLPGPSREAIDAKLVIGAFVAKAEELHNNWDDTRKYADAAARLDALASAANAALSAVGVPEMGVALGGGLECQFNAGTWAMTLPRSFFGTKPELGRMLEVASTCYHESRHAEQYFNMARMMAGQGKSKPEIKTACGGIESGKLDLAYSSPMPPTDPRARHYEQMLNNLREEENVRLINNVKNQKGAVEAAAIAWQQAREANSPDAPALRRAFGSAMATFKPLMERYDALDAEADAKGIEEKVKDVWLLG